MQEIRTCVARIDVVLVLPSPALAIGSTDLREGRLGSNALHLLVDVPPLHELLNRTARLPTSENDLWQHRPCHRLNQLTRLGP